MIGKEILYDVEKFKNLKVLLERTAEKYAENIAFIIKEKNNKEIKYKNITYKEFYDDTNAIGTALLKHELKDKKIAIIGKNRYEWFISYLAVLNGVGTVVPLDKGLPDNEIESLLERCKTDCVVFEDSYIDVMNNIRNKKESTVKTFICMNKKIEGMDYLKDLLEEGKELVKEDKSYLEMPIDEKQVKVLVYTSGTTSLSKAVMLSHYNIVENINGLNSIVKVGPGDVSLAFLPLHHTFGCTGQLFFICNGVTTAFCDGLRHIQENLKEYKVSVFVCVPLLLEAMYKKINLQIEKQGKTRTIKIARAISNFLLKFGIDIRRKIFKQVINQLGGGIRLAVSGAAGIDKDVVKGFADFGIKTIQGYGLTETAPVISAQNDKHVRYGSVGFALPNVDIEIFEPNEEGIGEIIAKGPNVMKGYYENEEATKEVLINGWFHTGDLGYIDKDGYLFITGRKKNVIVLKNGKNIYPEELELLISDLPYVLENMVFGYPKDDDLIVSVKIVYNKDMLPDLSEEEIYNKIWEDVKNINSDLTNYKHIKKLIVTDEPMIKTTTQKVKRFQEIEKILQSENK
ncbi:MAG: AMP-binding protein [Clostridia bacterium]|nr:AMP-binding protein [Clostridia bacterium]